MLGVDGEQPNGDDQPGEASNRDLHLPLGRSISTPVERDSESSHYERALSNAIQSPREYPIRRTDSMENVAEDNPSELLQELSSLKSEIVLYRTKNVELNKSLDRTNTLLREERKRRLSSHSPAQTPIKDAHNVEEEFSQQQENATTLHTISEFPVDGAAADIPPARRLSGERRNSVVGEETVNRRKLYGQRKASMSLDEMYDLFGVAKEVVNGGVPPTLSEVEVSDTNGVPVDTQK